MSVNDQHIYMVQSAINECEQMLGKMRTALEILRTKAPPKKNPTAAAQISTINADMMRSVVRAGVCSDMLERALRYARVEDGGSDD